MSYEAFVTGKLERTPPAGLTVEPAPCGLAAYQRDLVRWSLRRGRAAIFADTGLGKTRMQLAWADAVTRETGRPCLILAPLAVAQQSAAEGAAVGVPVTVCREQSDADGARIAITNYDRLHKFAPEAFGAVVLDESSIIKHHDAKTLGVLLEAFRETPYRLACTATPSPNDYTELGTHAEFLGVCSRTEMLSEFFVHDGGDASSWRLKGHARDAFWRFVASWGALVRRPSDLGYDDAGYLLPPLDVEHHMLAAAQEDVRAAGLLFAAPAATLGERRSARAATVGARVEQCAAAVNADAAEPWVVWCDLNAESEALTRSIRGAVEIRGSHTIEEKESALADFAAGRARVLISKPSICGFGLNWQHCARMAFVGVTDSWEAYYQAVRRCYRFGQRRGVRVHIYASELEGNVVANLRRKGADAERMADELSRETGATVRANVLGARRVTNDYTATVPMTVPAWCVEEAA